MRLCLLLALGCLVVLGIATLLPAPAAAAAATAPVLQRLHTRVHASSAQTLLEVKGPSEQTAALVNAAKEANERRKQLEADARKIRDRAASVAAQFRARGAALDAATKVATQVTAELARLDASLAPADRISTTLHTVAVAEFSNLVLKAAPQQPSLLEAQAEATTEPAEQSAFLEVADSFNPAERAAALADATREAKERAAALGDAAREANERRKRLEAQARARAATLAAQAQALTLARAAAKRAASTMVADLTRIEAQLSPEDRAGAALHTLAVGVFTARVLTSQPGAAPRALLEVAGELAPL